MDFGDAEHIKLSLMCDKEPKDTLKPPFKAGSSLNALAILYIKILFIAIFLRKKIYIKKQFVGFYNIFLISNPKNVKN
ncbi:MAG: hypothetical protein IIW03_03125 [Clostridia bacterium]|nr:hypothetical protein [Clostridia bacterium]